MECGRSGQYVLCGWRLLKYATAVFLAVGLLIITVHRFEAYRHCEAKFLQEQVELLEYKQRQQQEKLVADSHHNKDHIFYMSSAFEVSGLGNLMFQYASLIGVSKHYGMTPVIPSQLPLTKYFSLSAQILNDTRPGGKWGKIISNKSSAFENKVLKIEAIDQNLELVGFFQSWKYFENVDSAMKEEFRFSDEIERTAKEYIMSAINNYTGVFSVSNPTLVGVHVRRGDMTSARFREIGYTTVNASYIRAAMEYMERKHGNVLFIVCSDDLAWAADNVRSGHSTSMVQFSTGQDAATDLAILTMTEHLIMSTGTFSWWAGWLSRGEVVYYKDFPAKHSRLSRMFSRDQMDYFCPGWTALQ